MFPFLTYKKTIYVHRTAYALFLGIEKLDLSDKFFQQNDVALAASIRHSDPLIILFKSTKNEAGIEHRMANATLWASFQNVDNQTKVDIEVRSNVLFTIFSSIFGIAWLSLFLPGRFNFHLFITYLLLLFVLMIVDILAKRNILMRFEKMVNSI